VTTRHVDVPGGGLLVVDEGSGPPIAFLHASIADLRSWQTMIDPLNAGGYRTIRYDQRAVGGSDTEEVEFSGTDDLLAVLDACGVQRAVLVGNSPGGVLALDAAIEAPDRVVAVVGVAASLGGFDAANSPEEMAVFEETERLENQDPVDPSAIADIDVRAWVDGPGQPATRVPAAIRDLVHEMDLLDPSRPMGKLRRLDPPASERLSDLNCPILAVAGELDFGAVGQTARHLEANAPNARALVWPDVAHMIGMEQPERLSAAIVEFLAQLDRWS
jgi:pimeloyl-ACP methyl ester carboxylesterase